MAPGDDLGERGIRSADDGKDHHHAEGQRDNEKEVELLQFLLRVGHGAERGGNGGVNEEAEEEVDDEEKDLVQADGSMSAAAQEAAQAAVGDKKGSEHPDTGLGKANRADTKNFSSEKLFRLDCGEQNLKDAAG